METATCGSRRSTVDGDCRRSTVDGNCHMTPSSNMWQSPSTVLLLPRPVNIGESQLVKNHNLSRPIAILSPV